MCACCCSCRPWPWRNGGFLMNRVVVVAMAILAICVQSADDPDTQCFVQPSSPDLEKFVDELPLPPVLDVSTGQLITVRAYKFNQKLHRDLPSTTLYGFGTTRESAYYPGPTLEARRGIPTRIRWENQIEDDSHFLPVDRSIGIPNPPNGGVPIVVHLHGGEVPAYSDGNPDAWFTIHGETGPKFITQDYLYPNQQPPTTLWYHDHTIGITRLNIAAGLFGFYIIRSPIEENRLGLPTGDYEIPLVFQDKRFFENGHIMFPSLGSTRELHPVWCTDYLGDVMLVNGKVWPYFNVQQRRYRFRMLNGNTERFLNLTFESSRGPSPTFYQIGTDGGYLYKPQTLQSMLLAPAERADVIVDFSNNTVGGEVYLINTANTPYPDGRSPGNTKYVIKFNVVNGSSSSLTTNVPYPAIIRNQSIQITTTRSTRVRQHRLLDVYSGLNSIPSQFLLNYLRWEDVTTEIVIAGTTEIWEFINLTNEAHPIHIHLVNFIVKNLQRFDMAGYTNNTCSIQRRYPNEGSCFTAEPEDPRDFMVGWKDTVTVLPGHVVRITIRFTSRDGVPFSFDPRQIPGYLWHCHLLGHEDNDMMRPLQVV